MLDTTEYWEKQDTTQPYLMNGFNGPFKITSHKLIPLPLRNYLAEYFYSYNKLSRVPMDDINQALNKVWKGPGSMTDLINATNEMKINRLSSNPTTKLTEDSND